MIITDTEIKAMKKILFVGTDRASNYILELCDKLELELNVLGEYNHISDTVNPILAVASDVIIYDVTMFIDEYEHITEEVLKMRKLKSNNIIIINAIGYSEHSSLIKNLIESGIRQFVFAVNVGTRRDEFEKCLNGYYATISHPIVEAGLNIIATESIKPAEGINHSIGVCGTQARIGTTTNALQITKYLTYQGFNAAYVEFNDHGFVDMCAELYSEAQTNGKCVKFSGIDMYTCSSPSELTEILQLNYEFYVYDYGYFTEQNFQTMSFCEREYKVVVAGAKPNEFGNTQQLLQTNYYNDASLIFSFISEADRADISEMMMEMSHNVTYADWCPDPFAFDAASIKVMEQVINIEKKPSSKKKFTFFKKKG